MTPSRRDSRRGSRSDAGPRPSPSRPGRLDPSGDPLLAAKLTVPLHPATLVTRQRLLSRLSEGAKGPLTVITGAAGVGKTALAASWARSDVIPGPVVWVTLDADDGPATFWAYVLDGFRRGGSALQGVGVPAGAGDVDHSTLIRLAAAVESLPAPVVLVLDGFDKVRGHDVPAGLSFLVERAGPRLRLVLLSREDPLLPLHRYRAEQRLYEIRGSDLAFTAHEAAELLKGHGLTPGRDVVEALVGRTGGWAAGLRLCALAMERSHDPDGFARSFSASEHAVADYLLTEVLETQPTATRELLLRASILDQVHPRLADALTARSDGDRILTLLARAQAFVEPIADTGWYRFHPLFAAVLHAHLSSKRPGLETRLHHRAARWLADSGRITPALGHAALSGDWQFAAAQAVRHLMVGALVTDSDNGALARIFTPMPDSVDGAEPALVTAACRLSRQDLAGCRASLKRAEDHMEPPCGPEEQLTHALLRLLSEPFTDDDGAAVDEAASRVAGLMARVPHEAIVRHPEIEALRLYGNACARLRTGRLDEARTAFEQTMQACSGETTDVVRHQTLGRLALGEAMAGELNAAEEDARASLALADERAVPESHRSGAGHLALAAVAAERADVRIAAGHLTSADAMPDTGSDLVLVTERSVLGSLVAAALGRWHEAVGSLAEPGPQPPEPTAPAWLYERRALAHAGAALAHGDPATAFTVLDGVGRDGASWTLALAEAHLVAGHPAQAEPLLAGLDDAPGLSLPDRVRLDVLRARAAVLDGDPGTARELLEQAAERARPEQLRRPFHQAGPWVWRVLTGPEGRHGTLDWLTTRPPPGLGGPVPIEALSPREREVLEQVARMMSTDEIATELCVSTNTVKTHLRSIYRKLGVSRRREAVERGRQLHLI
ncbi:LuxR C-terminal-related transcriptional regulator [Streptomyces sp. NPDC006283]|uniref:LuxR C-terminal-related transcriptional regulator n=1 Tax=Streptomyces sp. NPDC006283 TaxID=3156741 RepID=UPI0033A69590